MPEVVIVGSGAGGGATAFALARRGVDVLLLEAGPAYGPADYPLHKPRWEQTEFPRKPGSRGRYTFADLQALDPGPSELRSWNRATGNRNHLPMRIPGRYHHVRGVGGSTLHYTGEAHRLHPRAMKMASRFGVAADWPLDYAELEPFYVEAERIVGVAGPEKDPTRPRSAPYPLPPHAPSFASRRLAAGCKKLGLSWTPNALAVLSAPYDGRPSCNYCACCNRGCPRRDKGSVDLTFIAKALATGRCTLKPESTVTRLEAGPDDRVARVHYVDSAGQPHSVAAKAVVVACGAIETPRLLLASADRHAPEGLGNESGQVGRNFMETLYWTAIGLHPEPLGSYRGLPSDSVCRDYNAPDAIPGLIGGCLFSPGLAEADLIGPINYAKRVVPGWGRRHKAEMREVFGRALGIKAMGESLPHGQSYVDLDPAEKDAFGLPLARIHSHLDAMAIRRLQFMAEKARAILKASGVERLVEEAGSYDAFNSTHVFGTCRMGVDPERSVVDAQGRSHRWRNLFIADASLFPSSGGGDGPSLTIEALALRNAEALRRRALRGEF